MLQKHITLSQPAHATTQRQNHTIRNILSCAVPVHSYSNFSTSAHPPRFPFFFFALKDNHLITLSYISTCRQCRHPLLSIYLPLGSSALPLPQGVGTNPYCLIDVKYKLSLRHYRDSDNVTLSKRR